jgi:transcriptional regulator NrdR family protein
MVARLDVLCPSCGSRLETRDTRRRADGSVKRRKVCACGFRATSIEQFAAGARALESDPGGTQDRELDQEFAERIEADLSSPPVHPTACACDVCLELDGF